MAKKSSFDFSTVAVGGTSTPAPAVPITQSQAVNRATTSSGGFDFSSVAVSGGIPAPAPTVQPVKPPKKKEESDTGLFGGMFSTDGSSKKADDSTSWYDWDSIKTAAQNGLDFSTGATQQIMSATNRMLGGAFTLAGGFLDVGEKGLTSLVDKYVYGDEKQAEKDLAADAHGITKYLLDAGDYIKQNEDRMRPQILKNLGVSDKNIVPNRTFIDAYSDGDLSDGTRMLFGDVANVLPQLVLAAYTGGTSLALTEGGLLTGTALAAEGTGLAASAINSLKGLKGAQFKFGLGLGASSSIAEEYAKDKNISATDLLESVSRGVVEGISETLFDTDIKAARQLFRNFVDTSQNPAIRGIANSILSEGEEVTRQTITRSAWDVMKKGFTGGKNEGLEEVAASFGNLLIDATKDGGFTMESFDKFKKDAAQSFIIGFLAGGIPSAYVAARTKQSLTDEQKKTIDRYSEIINNPEATQEAKTIAKERIKDIIDYNADLNKSTYQTIANLPIEKREEALGYLDEIKKLEESKKTARELTPEFDEQIKLRQEKVDKIVEENKLDLADQILSAPEAMDGNVAFSSGTQLTVTPDTGYVFNFDSPQDVPEALRQIEPISAGTVEGRTSSKFRVSYTGQDLIDAGLARVAPEISNEQIAEATADVDTTTNSIQDLLDNTPDALSEINTEMTLEEGETVARKIAEQYQKDKAENTSPEFVASVEDAIRKGMQQKVMATEPVVAPKPKRKRNVQTLRGMKPTEGVELSTNMVNDFTGVLGKLGRDTKQVLQNYVRALKSVRPEAKVFYYENATAMEKGLRNSGYSAARAKALSISSGGLFTTMNKGEEVIIHVNREADLSKKGKTAGMQSNTILAHEIVHATLLELSRTNPTEFITMKNSLLKMLAKDEAANDEIKEFVKFYSNEKVEVQAEEFLAQLGALITRQQATLQRSTLDKIKIAIREFLQKIATKFKSKALMDLVDSEVFSETAKAEDTARFLEGLGKSLREGTDIDMKYIKNLVKGSREYQAGLRSSVIETVAPMPSTMDANTLMNNDMGVEPEDVKQSMAEEGNWIDKGENRKRMTKYMSTIKGMTEDDVWLAKAISYNEDKGVKLYTLKDKESVLAALENQLRNIEESLNNEITGQNEFARDGELWESNGGYLFTGWKPTYIDNKIIYFSNPDTYNANELLRWNTIKEDPNYHRQEVGVIRDIQKKDLLANIKEFNGHNDFDPAFSYALINGLIYNKYQVVSDETTGEPKIDEGTGEVVFKTFKYKQNQLATTDGSYPTIQYDVAKSLYDNKDLVNSAGDIGMAYQRAYMSMGKLNVVNSKFSKYIDKRSSTGEGYWLKFPKGNDPDVAYDLFEIAKTSHKYPAKWCTGNSDGMAAGQLKDGDFYVFVDTKTGDARIAVRYEDNKIAEVRGLGEGQAILSKDTELIEEIASTFKDGKSYESYSKTLKDIKNITTNFLTEEEQEQFLIERDPDLSETRLEEFSNYVANNFSTDDILRVITEKDRSYGNGDKYFQNIQIKLKSEIQNIMEAKGEPSNTVVVDYSAYEDNTLASETIKYILGDLNVVEGVHNFEQLISVAGAIVIEGGETQGKVKMIANKLQSVEEEIDIEYGDFESTSIKNIGRIYMRDYSSSINLPNTTGIRKAIFRIKGDNVKLDSLEESQSIEIKIEGIDESFSLPKLKSTRDIILDGRGDANNNLTNFNLNLPSLVRVYDYISLIRGLSGDFGDVNIFAPNNVDIREVVNRGKQSLNINIGSGIIQRVSANGTKSSISINSQDSLSTSISDLTVDESGTISISNVGKVGDITIRDEGVLNIATKLSDVNNVYLIKNAKVVGETINNIGILTVASAEKGEVVEISAGYVETVSVHNDSSLRLLDNERVLTLLASPNSYVDISSKKINRISATSGSVIFANNLEEARIINMSRPDTFSAPQLFNVLEEISMVGYAENEINLSKLFEAKQVLVEEGGLEINSLFIANKILLKNSTFISSALSKVDEVEVIGNGLIKAKNLSEGYNLELFPALTSSESGKLTITDSSGTRRIQSEELEEEPSETRESRLGDIGQSSREEYDRRTKKTAKQELANVYNKSFERNEEARLAFKKADMSFSMYSMYLKAGASPFAMRKFADAYFKIYGGLTDVQIRNLDSVIYLERVIAIDNNFDNRGKKRPAHPDIDQDNGTKKAVNKEVAEQELQDYEDAFGKEYIDDLKSRAKEYFGAFSDILKYKYDNGLISKETYDLYKDYNYSPRKFLEHIIDVNGISQNTFLNRGLNLGSNEIKNIAKGSTDSMLFDSSSLLKAAFISAENRVFTNRALKFIFEEGTTRQNDVVRDANYVKLKDGTIKLDKDGTPIVKEASSGFVNKTYRDNNGKTYTFQMKSDIAQQFDDLELSSSKSGVQKFFTFILGANITRKMAVTLNPFFGLINPIFDLGTQVMFSNTYKSAGRGLIAQTIAGTREFVSITKSMLGADFVQTKLGQRFGLTESVKQGEIRDLIEEYGTYGGFMTTQSEVKDDANKLSKALSYYGNVTEVSAKLSAYKFLKDSMLKDFASENIDPLTGESIAPTEEQMRNIMISAAYHARETLDYNRGGKWSKDMSSYIPFLNVSMQVKKVGGQYIVNNPADFARKMSDGIFITAAITLLNLIVGADDYEKDPRIKNDKVDKTVILLPFTLKDLGLSDKEERAYIPLPTPSLSKSIFNIGQVMAEQIYYDATGKVNPNTGSAISKAIERNYQMFTREISGMFMPKTIQAGISYYANYDFWTGKKLTNDDKIVTSRQGSGNEDIMSTLKFIAEGIDKLTDNQGVGFGGGYSFSPEKLQKSIEVISTSARYNPIVNTAYWMIDNIFQASHKIMLGEGVEKRVESRFVKESLFDMIGGTFGKGFGRLVRFSDPDKFDMPDFNAQNEAREEIMLVDARIKTQKDAIYNDFLKIYDESKDQKNAKQYMIDKMTEYSKKIKDPRELEYAEGVGNFFYKKENITFKGNADAYYNISNVAQDPRAKAYAIFKAFGDVRGNMDLQKDLKNVGVTKEVSKQYLGLLIEKGLAQPVDGDKPQYEHWYKVMLGSENNSKPIQNNTSDTQMPKVTPQPTIKPDAPVKQTENRTSGLQASGVTPPLSNVIVSANRISSSLVASTINTSKETSNVVASIFNSIGGELDNVEKTVIGKIDLIKKAIDFEKKLSDTKAIIDNPNLILSAIQRQIDKGDESNIVSKKIAIPKQITPEFSLTGGKAIIAKDTNTVGKLKWTDSEYMTISSITDLNKVSVGERNRGDYKEGQGNLIANFLQPFSKPENLSDDKMYVGIKNGKLVTGNGSNVKDAQSVTQTPFAQVVEISDELIKNKSYMFPKLKTLKAGQEEKLNISTTVSGKSNANNKFAGGATIIETPDGSQKYLVRGSLDQVKSAFNDLKKNTKSPYLNMYILDNGSFSTGLFTKDNKSTAKELKSYDDKNVNGGHGIYLK